MHKRMKTVAIDNRDILIAICASALTNHRWERNRHVYTFVRVDYFVQKYGQSDTIVLHYMVVFHRLAESEGIGVGAPAQRLLT